MANEIIELSALVGAPVLASEPCGWGFENRTAIVTLEDGRRLVVQRMLGRAIARHKLRLARNLPDRLAAAGLRVPRLLAGDASAAPPYAVREYISGEAAASLMGSLEGAQEVARAMGALLPRLAEVPIAGAGLNDAWASPARLAGLARKQLARCLPLLGDPTIDALGQTIDGLPARFAGQPARFAHGDFCPVNVLIERLDDRADKEIGRQGDKEIGSVAFTPSPHLLVSPSPKWQVVALLDLEFARIADPLFDAAWWGWVVRYHHPERWAAAYPHLLAAAGIPHDTATLERITALQRLRCLEAVDYQLRTGRPEAAAMWAERLRATLAWD